MDFGTDYGFPVIKIKIKIYLLESEFMVKYTKLVTWLMEGSYGCVYGNIYDYILLIMFPSSILQPFVADS